MSEFNNFYQTLEEQVFDFGHDLDQSLPNFDVAENYIDPHQSYGIQDETAIAQIEDHNTSANFLSILQDPFEESPDALFTDSSPPNPPKPTVLPSPSTPACQTVALSELTLPKIGLNWYDVSKPATEVPPGTPGTRHGLVDFESQSGAGLLHLPRFTDFSQMRAQPLDGGYIGTIDAQYPVQNQVGDSSPLFYTNSPTLGSQRLGEMTGATATQHPQPMHEQSLPLTAFNIHSLNEETRTSEDNGGNRNSFSSISSASIAERQNKSEADPRKEKPKRNEKISWHRVNKTTQGKTKRSAKINDIDDEKTYEVMPAPFPSWTHRGRNFDYNERGELVEATMSAKAMRSFINNHPYSRSEPGDMPLSKLIIWIQRSPADSGTRNKYLANTKCRFRDCPLRVNGWPATILHGHYRVALDETWDRYGDRKNPHSVAAYTHLYCFERFMNLPEICRLEHVQVRADARAIDKEPRGIFAATLKGEDHEVASKFIKAQKSNKPSVKTLTYPAHDHSVHPHPPKEYQNTLNYKLQVARNHTRPDRISRLATSSSQMAVHMGDLEVFVQGRLAQKAAKQSRRDSVQTADEEETIIDEGNEDGVDHVTQAEAPSDHVAQALDLDTQFCGDQEPQTSSQEQGRPHLPSKVNSAPSALQILAHRLHDSEEREHIDIPNSNYPQNPGSLKRRRDVDVETHTLAWKRGKKSPASSKARIPSAKATKDLETWKDLVRNLRS